MEKFHFPFGMRVASIDERERFYREEFNERKARRYIKSFVKVDTGRNTGIVKEGLPKKLLILKPFSNLREKLIYYAPEDVYYDRNIYRSLLACKNCRIFFGKVKGKYCWWTCKNVIGQELAFDIDPENFSAKIEGSIYSFSEDDFFKAKEATLELYEWLKEWGFKRMAIFYSGRGFHITVNDSKAIRMGLEEREKLVEELPEKLRQAIDPWVTRGNIRLLRLPYTLNAMVSRIAIPLSKEDLYDVEFLERAIPEFVKEKD